MCLELNCFITKFLILDILVILVIYVRATNLHCSTCVVVWLGSELLFGTKCLSAR